MERAKCAALSKAEIWLGMPDFLSAGLLCQARPYSR
jgi:hypothetical protein